MTDAAERKRALNRARYAAKRDQIKEQNRRYYHSNKERDRERRRKYHQANRERIINRVSQWNDLHAQERKSYKLEYKEKNIRSIMLSTARRRAADRGLEFDLQITDVAIPEKCPVLGLDLKASTGRMQNCSPTLDRIDSSRGYTRDNVRVISWRANRLKSDATIEEVAAILAYMESNICAS